MLVVPMSLIEAVMSFPLVRKWKILDMIEIEQKKSYVEIARLYGKNESSIREVMKNKEKIALLYRLLWIRLKYQNPLLSYVRERKYTVNVQCSVQYTLLLFYFMLVMSYCT